MWKQMTESFEDGGDVATSREMRAATRSRKRQGLRLCSTLGGVRPSGQLDFSPGC